MENKYLSKSIVLGISLVIGLFLLGFFIYKGLKTFSDKDRVVTVKGLAEMNVTAISSDIILDFSFSGDNLKDLIKQTDSKKSDILLYLNKIGYDKKDILLKNIGVIDRQKYYEIRWTDGKQIQEKIDRYTIMQSITIKSKDVVSTEDKASKIELDLISNDLTSNVKTDYSFPELNTIKPKLIAESTKNARIAGEQFANDSQAKLGKIKTASQGQITFIGEYNNDEEASETIKNPSEPYIKKARVVSSIVFFLE